MKHNNLFWDKFANPFFIVMSFLPKVPLKLLNVHLFINTECYLTLNLRRFLESCNDAMYFIVVLYSEFVFKVTSQYCHPNYNVKLNFLLYEINRRKCWRILYFPY